MDEAQDLTQEQFEVIRAVGVHKNIFVVADDDQSIYGFRGAAPSCIRTFYQSEPDCKLYHLVRNYRSVKSIVELSDMLIQKKYRAL